MNSITSYRDRADRFEQILTAAEGRWGAETPCDDWTVADGVRQPAALNLFHTTRAARGSQCVSESANRSDAALIT